MIHLKLYLYCLANNETHNYVLNNETHNYVLYALCTQYMRELGDTRPKFFFFFFQFPQCCKCGSIHFSTGGVSGAIQIYSIYFLLLLILLTIILCLYILTQIINSDYSFFKAWNKTPTLTSNILVCQHLPAIFTK